PHQLGEASIMADSQNARRSASLTDQVPSMRSMYRRALRTQSSRLPGQMGAGGLTGLASSESPPRSRGLRRAMREGSQAGPTGLAQEPLSPTSTGSRSPT